MGFVTEKVSVIAKKFTIGQYYENLGYDVPKKKLDSSERKRTGRDWGYDSKVHFEVDVKDLYQKSKYKIIYSCDSCGKNMEMPIYRYKQYNRNGLYYCIKCTMSLFYSGENSFNWNSELSDEDRETRRLNGNSYEYSQSVLKRDNYICQCCFKKINKDGEVHHLDGWNWCKEKRFDLSNGISLCSNCHKNFHSIYGYGNNTKKQFEEWIQRNIYIRDTDIELPTRKQIICLNNLKIYDNVDDAAFAEGNSVYNIYRSCYSKQRTKGKYYLYLDEYNALSEEDIESILSSTVPTYHEDKRIILLNDLSVYKTTGDAANILKIKDSVISQNAKGRTKSLNITDENDYNYVFMYYTEFLNLPEGEHLNILEKEKYKKGFICLSTGIIYKTSSIAAKELGFSNSAPITSSIKRNGTCGKHPITNEPMKWISYNKFIELSSEQKKNLILKYKESLFEDSFLFNYYTQYFLKRKES